MTALIHNMAPPRVTISYRGHGGEKAGGAGLYHLRDSSTGRWVGISLPNLPLLRPHTHCAERDGTAESSGTAPNPGYLEWILDQLSIPQDPNSGKELARRIRERARALPIPGACLVKRLESLHDFMPEARGAARRPDDGRETEPPCAPALAPFPLYSWENDLTAQLAVVTQSSRHVWLRDKMPILSRIHSDYAHMAILLPRDFSDSHIREIPPRRLREVAHADD